MDGRARALLVGLMTLVVVAATLSTWAVVSDDAEHSSRLDATPSEATSRRVDAGDGVQPGSNDMSAGDAARQGEARTRTDGSVAVPADRASTATKRRSRHANDARTGAQSQDRTAQSSPAPTEQEDPATTSEAVSQAPVDVTPETAARTGDARREWPGGALVTGTVRSEDPGRRLAGARVETRDWYDVVAGPTLERGDGKYDSALRQLVLEDGRFYVDRPDDGARVVITLSARGHVPFVHEVDPDDVHDRPLHLDVVLERSGFLAGIVRDQAGEPVYDAHVHAIEADVLRAKSDPELTLSLRELLWGHGRYDEETHYRRDFARTNSEGRFVHYDVRRNTRYVLFAVSKHHGCSLPAPPVHSSDDPSRSHVELTLRPLARVSIDYRDAAGRRRSDATVAVLAGPHTGSRHWERLWDTSAAGHVVHPQFVPGPQWIEVELPNAPDDRHRITVLPGQENHFVLRAPGGRTIDVWASDSDGRPLSGVRVHCFAFSSESPGSSRSAFEATNDQGRVVFEGVPATEVEIGGSKQGYVETDTVVAPGADTTVRLHLRPARTVALDVQPAPAENRAPELHYAFRRSGATDEDWMTGSGDWDEASLRIQGVPVDEVELRLWAPGHREAVHHLERTQPGVVPKVQVRLGAAIRRRVRLVDDAGAPVAGATLTPVGVRDLHPALPLRTLFKPTTGDDGVAEFFFAGDEPVRLFVLVDGHEPAIAFLEPTPGAAPLEVELTRLP